MASIIGVARFLTPLAAASLVSAAGAQAPPKFPAPVPPAPVFASETVLAVNFTTNIKQLRGDKTQEPPWRAATLTYTSAQGSEVTLPVRARTRGIWRLNNCDFPPVRFNFGNQATRATVFDGVDRPKLVNFCRDNEQHEEYILQEYQLYRVYSVLTEASHRARLLRMTYTDSATKRPLTTRYAFLIEDPDSLAGRLGGTILEAQNAGPGDLDSYLDALTGVFQYMVGNTDVNVAKLHNVELVAQPMGKVFPVAYDFDFAGAVNARYATVDPVLPIARVRDRYFQGYCVEPQTFTAVFKLFNDKKDAIYALYRDEIGKLLKPKTVDDTIKYFDAFYKILNDPRQAKREILDACARRSGN